MKMAKDFFTWLDEDFHERLSEEQINSEVLVVSVIGKEVADNTKADLLNNFLGHEVFLDRWVSFKDECKIDDAASELVSIDVFFDAKESILWLLLNGASDLAVQHFLFHANISSKSCGETSFFEKMAFMERQELKMLAVIFQICHAILIVDQGCRFDLDWINTLKHLNRFRPKISKRIRHALSTISESELNEKYPRILRESGRLAMPRFLFCFYRNPLRSDLNQAKKKELLEKMEKCLESQIANLLKQFGLLDNRYPENALGQVTIASGVPFVYCFQHSEARIDINNELVMALFEGSTMAQNICDDGSVSSGGTGREPMSSEEVQRIIADITGTSCENRELDPCVYNFHYFLNKALNKLRQSSQTDMDGVKKNREKMDLAMELPTFKQFVESVKLVKRCVIDELGKEISLLKVVPELDTIESLVDSALWSAQAVYTRQLQLQPEITGGGDPVFSNLEHEYTFNMALDYLKKCCPRATGSHRRQQMIQQLRNRCHNTWLDGHQRCERLSLTGQLCHFMINHEEIPCSIRDRSQSGSRSISARQHSQHNQQQTSTKKAHCSGVKTFSMCNCGLSRHIRFDPFDLKEANYDFYMNTTTSDDYRFAACCSQLDQYTFKVFNPATSAIVTTINRQSQSPPIQSTSKMTSASSRLFDLLAPKVINKNIKEKTTIEHENEEEEDEADRLGMLDPSDFNVRFFDNNNAENEEDQHSGDEHTQFQRPNQAELFASEDEDGEKPMESGAISHNEDIDEDDEDEEEEEKPRARRRRKGTDMDDDIDEEASNDDEEEEEAEESEDEKPTRRQNEDDLQQKKKEDSVEEQESNNEINPRHSSPSKSPQWPSPCSSPEPQQHYLDKYDSHLLTRKETDIESDIHTHSQNYLREWLDDPNFLEKFKGQYLEHIPHTSSPTSLLPLFPSFSIVCLGHSSVYNHSTGIRGAEERARFRNGSEFLMPWSVDLMVNTGQWVRELQYIGVVPSERTMRNLQNGISRNRIESKEKVKLFIGFDYECPRGHRFMLGDQGKPLKHRRASGPLKQDAAPLMENDLPIWMPCACRKEPRTTAQLMRIHVVTPKAPVSVFLQPMIQMPDDDTGFFYPGAMERIELGWAKYYVCRLPYAYVGPKGPTYKPSTLEYKGRLMHQCVHVSHLPIAESTYAS